MSFIFTILMLFVSNAQANAYIQNLIKLAERGDVFSQVYLGHAYATGFTIERDYARASAWYLKAAEQGDMYGQYQLGLLYANGQGFLQNYPQAAIWIRKAAEQGLAAAQCMLGVMYENGRGVRQNKDIAKEWFGKGCDAGLQEGCDGYRRLNESHVFPQNWGQNTILSNILNISHVQS